MVVNHQSLLSLLSSFSSLFSLLFFFLSKSSFRERSHHSPISITIFVSGHLPISYLQKNHQRKSLQSSISFLKSQQKIIAISIINLFSFLSSDLNFKNHRNPQSLLFPFLFSRRSSSINPQSHPHLLHLQF